MRVSVTIACKAICGLFVRHNWSLSVRCGRSSTCCWLEARRSRSGGRSWGWEGGIVCGEVSVNSCGDLHFPTPPLSMHPLFWWAAMWSSRMQIVVMRSWWYQWGCRGMVDGCFRKGSRGWRELYGIALVFVKILLNLSFCSFSAIFWKCVALFSWSQFLLLEFLCIKNLLSVLKVRFWYPLISDPIILPLAFVHKLISLVMLFLSLFHNLLDFVFLWIFLKRL